MLLVHRTEQDVVDLLSHSGITPPTQNCVDLYDNAQVCQLFALKLIFSINFSLLFFLTQSFQLPNFSELEKEIWLKTKSDTNVSMSFLFSRFTST